MQLGRFRWGPFRFQAEIDMVDCFMMPSNIRSLGRKLIKWIAQNAWTIIGHESFVISRNYLSCRFEGWEIPHSPLPLHYVSIQVDLVRNTISLTVSIAV